MPVMEISVVPVGTKTPSVSKYVAGALEVLKEESEVRYELTSMGTIVEGDLDKILALARKMHEVPFSSEVRRVVTTIKIDDRRDKELSIKGKMDAVKRIIEDRTDF